jgi:hypothetical protein
MMILDMASYAAYCFGLVFVANNRTEVLQKDISSDWRLSFHISRTASLLIIAKVSVTNCDWLLLEVSFFALKWHIIDWLLLEVSLFA